MVQWKSKIKEDDSGEKAANLDSINEFNVPNFFTITKKEVEKFVEQEKSSEAILNKKIPSNLRDNWLNAFKDLGMSSEVRNSSGRARNLVTGQRTNVQASIRISSSSNKVYSHEIYVSKKNFEKRIKETIASYYRKNQDSKDAPALIVQKMIEPEQTGSIITDYKSGYTLVESVEGLGVTLEEGETIPEAYLIKDNAIIDKRIPEAQLRAEKHPVNGRIRRKQIDKSEQSFRDEELLRSVKKLEKQGFSVKFVYKRGTFYIVDVKEAQKDNPFRSEQASLNGIRASKGSINGRIGKDIEYVEKPQIKNKDKPQIAKKGGYSSKESQRARNHNKPLIVSYKNDLSTGEQVEFSSRGTKNQNRADERDNRPSESRNKEELVDTNNTEINEAIASEVIPINAQNGLTLTPPHHNSKYSIKDSESPKSISRQGYLDTYQKIFQNGKNKDRVVLDTRKLGKSGLEQAIEYIEADKKQIMVLEEVDADLIYKAIDQGFETFAITQHRQEKLEKVVEKQEKKYILDKLRQID